MTTFDVFVDGKEIIKAVPSENIEEVLKTLRGLVWTSGGSDDNIEIKPNNL